MIDKTVLLIDDVRMTLRLRRNYAIAYFENDSVLGTTSIQ